MSDRRGYTLIEVLAVMSLLTGLAVGGVRCFRMLQQIDEKRESASRQRSEIDRFATAFRTDFQSADRKKSVAKWPIEIDLPSKSIRYTNGPNGQTVVRDVIDKGEDSKLKKKPSATDVFDFGPNRKVALSSENGWLQLSIARRDASPKTAAPTTQRAGYLIEVKQ